EPQGGGEFSPAASLTRLPWAELAKAGPREAGEGWHERGRNGCRPVPPSLAVPPSPASGRAERAPVVLRARPPDERPRPCVCAALVARLAGQDESVMPPRAPHPVRDVVVERHLAVIAERPPAVEAPVTGPLGEFADEVAPADRAAHVVDALGHLGHRSSRWARSAAAMCSRATRRAAAYSSRATSSSST